MDDLSITDSLDDYIMVEDTPINDVFDAYMNPMETAEELTYFSVKVDGSTMTLDHSMSRSGLSSARMDTTYVSSNKADQFGFLKKFKGLQNKVINIWIYDELNPHTSVMIKASETTAGGVASSIGNKLGRAAIGISSGHDVYLTRLGNTGVDDTAITRTKVWHQFTWDYTNGTSAELYIDGILVGSHPANGVDALVIDNYWQKQPIPFYVDDFSISESMDDYI